MPDEVLSRAVVTYMADRVEHALRRERPELTTEAIHDLANHFAYAQQ